MTTYDEATAYINILAEGLAYISSNNSMIPDYMSSSNFNRIQKITEAKLDSIWCGSNIELIKNIQQYVDSLKNLEETDKMISYLVICYWMDKKITYKQIEVNDKKERIYISLYNLLPLVSGHQEVNSLNDNSKETNIWINPKFSIFPTYEYRDGKQKQSRVYNRDAFYGINGELINISYFNLEEFKHNISVRNIILPPTYLEGKKTLKIAFSPLTDNQSVLNLHTEKMIINNIEQDAIILDSLKDEDYINNRFINDWKNACDNDIDIFFAPEMIGTEYLYKEKAHEINDVLFDNALKRVIDKKSVSKLTILPTRWLNNENYTHIIDNTGRILAKQKKHIPFRDIHGHEVEGIKQVQDWEFTVIHIDSVHRIGVIICAEFLENKNPEINRLLYECLGLSLVIVPSFSRKEIDFKNEIKAKNIFGTTVIWGNCCGANKDDIKNIGGCALPGYDQAVFFGDKTECEFDCKNCESCVFIVELPLMLELKDTTEININEIISHFYSTTENVKKGVEDGREKLGKA